MKLITIAALTTVLALGTVACSSDGGSEADPTTPTTPTETTDTETPTGETHEVEVVDIAFEPAEVSIAVGDTVNWTWVGTSASHNVVADLNEGEETPAFSSGTPTKEEGTTYSFTFEEAGTWTYVCQVHPDMKGTVNVA